MPNTADGREMRKLPNGLPDPRDNILTNHARSRRNKTRRPARAVPNGWPKWPVKCHGKTVVDWRDLETGEIVRPKGVPCRAWAVLGSDYCRHHHGWNLDEETRTMRYLIFVLTGKVVEKPHTKVRPLFNMLVEKELEMILDGRRPEIRPRVREDILLSAFKCGIIHP